MVKYGAEDANTCTVYQHCVA